EGPGGGVVADVLSGRSDSRDHRDRPEPDFCPAAGRGMSNRRCTDSHRARQEPQPYPFSDDITTTMTAASDALSRWHQMAVEAVLEQLHASPQGLSAAEAQDRLVTHGPNVLTQARRGSALGMFLRQFRDFMILVLLVAAVISGVIGEVGDTIAIIAILVVNAVIGFVQEYRAERAMEALRAMAAPTATVLRDGHTIALPAAE